MNLWQRQIGQNASPTYTFRPLSRNRYRCVQTGEIVKKARLDSYGRMKVNGGRPREARHYEESPRKSAPPRTSYGMGYGGSSLFRSYWD